jgi:hypothetical protein
MGDFPLLALAVIVFIVLMIFAVIYMTSRYQRCPSDKILVVAGRDPVQLDASRAGLSTNEPSVECPAIGVQCRCRLGRHPRGAKNHTNPPILPQSPWPVGEFLDTGFRGLGTPPTRLPGVRQQAGESIQVSGARHPKNRSL